MANHVDAESLTCLPRWMRFQNRIANGLAVDIFGRATIAMSSMFLGPALLEMARLKADECVECNGRVYGFKPSSLLANIATVSSILGSITLPFVGAVVDHTPFRKQVGAYTAAGLIALKIAEISIGPTTWFMVALLQIGTSILFNFHLTSICAYIADLSSDASIQTAYNTSLYVIMFISTILYLLIVLVPVTLADLDDVGTARVGLLITSVTTLLCFSYAWTRLFPNRPALRHIPPGTSLWSCGFIKVWNTTRFIGRRYPALVWLMGSIAFADAAAQALIAVATTYMKEVLEMSASQISVVFFVVLISGIPGSKVAAILAARSWSPLHSMMSCNFLFIVSTVLGSIILLGPEDKEKVYWFGAAWGVGLGWLQPVELSAYVSLVEKGQEAEMMGIYLLVGQVLSWLPPLTFTILNENNVPMSLALASLAVFFALAILALCGMGSYGDALQRLEWTREGHKEDKTPPVHESELPEFQPVPREEEEEDITDRETNEDDEFNTPIELAVPG